MKRLNDTGHGGVLRRFVAASGALFLAAGYCFANDRPAFRGIGFLSGHGPGSTTQAGAATPDGSVVLGSSIAADGNYARAFRWTHAGGITPLGAEPAGLTSLPGGMSADGSVVVGTLYPTPQDFHEAFRWTQGTGFVRLGGLAGASKLDSFANGVSADGSVVVGGSYSPVGEYEAYRWTAGSGMQGLGDLPGGIFRSSALAVSADGTVVIGYGMSAVWQEAFRWTADGGMVGLGDLPGGGTGSQAVAMSADGSVVVGGSGSAAAEYEAFRWTAESGMVGLGDLPGGRSFSIALGTTADGSVVVGESIGASSPGPEAFVWDGGDGMRSVEDWLVQDFGLDLTGWHLETARISGDGTTLAGRGINPAGQREAWVAVIPEPRPMLVLMSLSAVLVARPRRGGKASGSCRRHSAAVAPAPRPN